MTKPTEPETILEEAIRITSGARRGSYGHPENNFGRIADLWNAYLTNKPGGAMPITPQDTAPLPGWLASRGASLEVKTAQALSIPVFPVEHWVANSRAALEYEQITAPPPRTLDDLRLHAHENSLRWFPAIHKRPVDFLIHSALGLAGETGEAVDVIKKAHREPKLFAINTVQLGAELADVFVYLLHLCTAAGIDLEDEYLRKSAFNETRFGTAPLDRLVAQEG